LAGRGKRPKLPEGATGELAEAFDELDKVAKRSAELTEEVARLEENAGSGSVDLGPLLDATERAAKGERTRAPPGADAQTAQLFGELGALAERIGATDQEAKARRSEAEKLLDRATAAEFETKSARDELYALKERLAASDLDAKAARNELSGLRDRLA